MGCTKKPSPLQRGPGPWYDLRAGFDARFRLTHATISRSSLPQRGVFFLFLKRFEATRLRAVLALTGI